MIIICEYSNEGSGSVLEEIVEALCRHVSDDSPMVRRLCLRGLVQVIHLTILIYIFLNLLNRTFFFYKVFIFYNMLLQIPPIHINTHTKEILGVILALLDDSDESVQLTAVLCLLSVYYLIITKIVYFFYKLESLYFNKCYRFLSHHQMVWSMFYLICVCAFAIFR